jgi:hypothetical protein
MPIDYSKWNALDIDDSDDEDSAPKAKVELSQRHSHVSGVLFFIMDSTRVFSHRFFYARKTIPSALFPCFVFGVYPFEEYTCPSPYEPE